MAVTFSQLSPGELTNAHKHLEGLSKCTQCHELGENVTRQKCLDCHQEIKYLIDNNKGYHVSLEVTRKECYECHNEHHGRNFQIVRFDKEAFKHELTGFILEGKHKSIDCNQCHNKDLINEKTSQKSDDNTFLGLGTTCLSCHDDYHNNTLSKNCVSCHNMESFKPASGFKHENTRFPLKGKHQETSCIKCHKVEIKNEVKYQNFKGIPFDNCTSCHTDVHNNKFGQDCKKCHNENSFVSSSLMKNFDHDKTNFTLQGKHVKVDCKSCHKSSFTKAIPHNNCTDCHSDYHKGQLKKSGIAYDCHQCHTVNDFSPASYTLEQHNQSSFPLKDSHMAIPCFSCHVKDSRWEFKNIGVRCIDCHKNIHQDIISEKYIPEGKCETCHNLATWNSVDFNHEKTNFILEGKHITTSCKKCHFTESSDNNVKQTFKNLSTQCEDCHNDVHREQFIENEMVLCNRCHKPASWTALLFDHDAARFKLDGAHKKVSCNKCHTSETDTNGAYTIYKFNSEKKCADCHAQ